MRVVVKKVYYCDFCKKHSLRPLTKHEATCTGNQDRECYWGAGYSEGPHLKATHLRPHIEWCKRLGEIDDAALTALRELVNGCPACMLSVIRQAKPEDVEPFRWWGDFDYAKEKKRFWDEYNEREHREAERTAMY